MNVVVIVLLILAIVAALVGVFHIDRCRWVAVAVALIAAAMLAPHLG